MDHTVALLIVACPCALGLATPLTLAVAVGRAARSGLLVKDAAIFERLARRGRLLVDKTGTITRGAPILAHWFGEEEIRADVAALESASSHPVGRALVRALEDEAVPGVLPDEVEELLDGGIRGRVQGRELRVGSLRHLAAHGTSIPEAFADQVAELEAAGESVIGVALGGRPGPGRLVALGGLIDAPRSGAREALQGLTDAGWEPEILSGDGPGAVERTAAAVGVKLASAGVEPEQKLARVRELQAAGDATVMVGDGVNDAAALAAADVGIAVHGGAEASLAAADVFASRPGLDPVLELVHLSRRALRTIRQNLALSLAYNAVAISLAAAGFVDPLVAAVIMPVGSAAVLVLALVSLGRGPLRGPLSASRGARARRVAAQVPTEALPCP